MSLFSASKPLVCLVASAVIVFSEAAPVGYAEDVKSAVANTREVTLPVTVRDKHGKIVRDLAKEDFTLKEDGRDQTITSYSRDTNLPLTLGLLVDTSPGQGNVLDAERNASRNFIDHLIAKEKENEKVFLIHFDRQVELLQDLTSSQDKVHSGLDLLQAPGDPERSNDPKDADESKSNPDYRRGGNRLYDSIFLASSELLKNRPGRKILIILSNGTDRNSKTYLNSAIESAQRADAAIYCVYYFEPRQDERKQDQNQRPDRRNGPGGNWPGGGGGGPGWPPNGGGGGPGGGRQGTGQGRGQRDGDERRSQKTSGEGKKILERISRETGGRFFEVSKKQSVGEIYDAIADELNNQYRMSFVRDKDSEDSGYHHLVLQVKRKELTVQTREGYFAGR